ncbi:C40 family peptidase [Antrihabitans cavernicola]|uniref:NlpC/P60 family protein n=1 Tax=Antrihabitans cavernicola TaxID=2495913 RepID=A0A5A7S9N3_9NOCA|nr:C40 family peptidase [Spelaeibacter cavernicola]KAA0021293.1 NlpC/P60 family protein [Spelaeibacter cavernicola]
MRGALVLGAVTVGAVAVPAAPAMAQTIDVPGIGHFDVPDLPAMPALPALPALPAPPQLPSFAPPANPLVQTDGQRALDAAKTKVGAQYVWGASGPYAFDCSGLIQWSYKQAGVSVPRTTYELAQSGVPISKADLQPGDVVLYDGGGHGALYAGDGKIVHASTAGQPVKYAPLDSMPFYAARRF